MLTSRWHIYYHDLFHRGLSYFISSRLKKRPFLRKIFYFFKPSYILLGRYKLFINKTDTVVSESLLNTGVWEPNILRVFKKYVRSGDTVVEIGAHIGDFTLLASESVGPQGHVYAFEPSSHNFGFLSKTVSTNQLHNVTLIQKAVSSKTGSIRLYLCPDNQGDHRTYPSIASRKSENVSTTTLDKFFGPNPPQINILKIDIQGSEYQAFMGMKNLLQHKKIKIIISELYPKGLKLAGASWQQYLELLKKSGFQIFIISDSTPHLTPLKFSTIQKLSSSDPEYTTNLLCLLKP